MFAQTNDSVIEFSNKFDVVSININTSSNEMAPFMYGSELYFGSNRKTNPEIKFSQKYGSEDLYDIYKCERLDSITFSKPSFSNTFSSIFNDGHISFNQDGTQALITTNLKDYRCLLKDPKEQQGLKIYYAVKNKGHWSKPQIHPLCEGTFSYCHGTFCNNNNTIIFASDMPGGFGGMDLYITEFVNNKWTKPRNMGWDVNSASNELFPFVNKAGMLFFSSNKSGGYGGYDIYSILLEDLSTGTSELLESPLNSSKDDFGIWTDPEGSSGYLTSNRIDNAGDNIFYFYKILPKFEKEIVARNKFCYTFFEEASVTNSDTTGLEYEWTFGNGEKHKGLEVKHCFEKPGTYPVQLNIIDRSSGELFYNDLSYDFVVEEPKQLNIACVDTITIGSILNIDASTSLIEGYTIKKYYWTFDDGLFSIGTKARHKYLKKGLHTIKLGVLAECDSNCKEATFYSEKNIFVKEKNMAVNLIKDNTVPDQRQKPKGKKT
jgi:hypothetical protein